jgi:hypothetical protein
VGNELVNVGGVWTLKEAAAGGAADPTLAYRRNVPSLVAGHLDAHSVDFDNTYGFSTPYNVAYAFGTATAGETTAFSVSLWVYMDATGGVNGLVTNKETGNSGTGWSFYISTNKARVIFYSGGQRYVDGPANLVAGAWYHMVMTKAAGAIVGGNTGSTTTRVYLNNVVGTSGGSWTAVQGSLQHTDKLRIGQWNGSPSYDFANGRLENIGVWNIELTPANVASLYNSGVGVAASSVAGSNLVAGYLCNALTSAAHLGSGLYSTSLEDSSGNDFTMASLTL